MASLVIVGAVAAIRFMLDESNAGNKNYKEKKVKPLDKNQIFNWNESINK